MADRDLLPGEYALLGLLRIRPMHGYEMARTFEGEGLGEVCPVEQSLLYSYLRNLEGRGLIGWKEQRVGKRPPRKQFSLSKSGTKKVKEWLTAPVPKLRQVRYEFLVKLYVLHELDRDAERELVRAQVAVCDEYLRDVAARLGRAEENFERLIASSKLSAAQGTANWLRLYLDELEDDGAGDA